MDESIAVEVKNLSKSFVLPHQKAKTIKSLITGLGISSSVETEAQHALTDVSFNVKKGEFFGIVGRNGSGKSTLLKLLAGIYQPTKGSVRTVGRIVPFIELGVGFNPELSGRDNVYLNGAMLGFTDKEIDGKYDSIVHFAELEKFMDQKLKNYSSGMQVRLAFSVATVLADSDILLLDEVLAVGDADFQKKCFEYFKKLKSLKKTVIFVTHDMSAVNEYCDRAILIENSKILHEGTARSVASNYSKLLIDNSKTQNEISQNDSQSPSGEVRWGDAVAEITSVQVNPGRVLDKDKSISINVEVNFKEDCERPIFGFSVKSSNFVQLIGTNTLRTDTKIPKYKRGTVVNFSWKIPNIFNSGLHYVDCTVAHDQATTVADRWPDAATFKVVRAENNPYLLYSDSTTLKIEGK